MPSPFLYSILLLLSFFSKTDSQSEEKTVEIPHIDFIEMSAVQPQQKSVELIWYDDFSSEKQYMEAGGRIDYEMNFGLVGGSMEAGFDKGDVGGNGGRKVAFGDFPSDRNVVRKGEHFDEIYWRIYVKHEYGWEGAPAKMSRATSIVASNRWKQAMIAHVWSGRGNSITLDPARGILNQSDSVITQHYNDFDNLTWLGNSPSSDFQISSTEESGYWVLVESMVKLNTPGKNDGLCRLWIDGRLEAERNNLNLRGSYTQHGVNAVFLESYWNSGAPKTENRWFDNFVISTNPIGPITCTANPVLHKTPWHGSGQLSGWEVQLSSDIDGNDTVYSSKIMENNEKVTVKANNGQFFGSLSGKTELISGKQYFCRVRQKDTENNWSEWSRWHQPFIVE